MRGSILFYYTVRLHVLKSAFEDKTKEVSRDREISLRVSILKRYPKKKRILEEAIPAC